MIRRSKVAKSDTIKVTFALPQDNPTGNVSVVGDFNNWTPGEHVLAKRTNGTRSVSVTVPKGTSVRFRYLAEGGQWFDDPEADRRDHDAGVIDLT
ncbi:MAG TPA: isoamylase early set domain-containing protein [Mycobacteriales bacterium]|nr:isoamylase early set domain-containing protein [Mycobacteriales bacterium]